MDDHRIAAAHVRIEGHTDAVGSDLFNLKLSQERAQAVVQVLAAEYHVALDRLVPEGLGKSQLLLPADPTNAANRRVRVVLLSAP